ncbi:cytochrome c-type biogenesis protein CcmH [Aquamicrobium segne]|uniref:Cytochrome c-type biogenesis protein n=1 Tax=Aquamicrobium segne TaxID=469547 RepID=A0ABW0H029_9HYPH
MIRCFSFLALFCVALLAALPVQALTPGEILDDPVLEQRARGISAGLRCLVCQNQSIDDSDADLARDLRVLVRERIEAGDTDAQVIDFVVSRYGEFVLLKPRLTAQTLLLWSAPLLLLLAGGAFVFLSARRKPLIENSGLTDEERAALDEMLKRNQSS